MAPRAVPHDASLHGRPRARRVLVAALVAGALSGVPSTIHASSTGRSPLAAARAAGELLGRPGLARGLVAHAIVTVWWTAVLDVLVPDRPGRIGTPVLHGAIAGAGIAALDLTLAHRRWPTIAALPLGGQLADHVAFGAIAAFVLRRGPAVGAQR